MWAMFLFSRAMKNRRAHSTEGFLRFENRGTPFLFRSMPPTDPPHDLKTHIDEKLLAEVQSLWHLSGLCLNASTTDRPARIAGAPFTNDD